MLTLQGPLFARKIIVATGWVTKEEIDNHVRIVSKLCFSGNRNIVKAFSQGYNPENSLYFLDMELCNGTLFDYINGVERWEGKSDGMTPEQKLSEMWNIMRQLSDAVRFIHSCKEVHRDIKPPNSILCRYDN